MLFTKNRQNKKVSMYIILISIFCMFLFEGIDLYAASKNTFFAGTAKVKITPETPIPMWGYGQRKGLFDGVHDDIYGRVIVFSNGQTQATLISVEVLGIPNSFWQNFTELLTQETGINKDYIFLSAVHTHGGPLLAINNDTTIEIVNYTYQLQKKLIGAVKEAIRNLIPVKIGAGKGESLMNINRRASNGNGRIILGMNPYGSCDHELGIIRVDDLAGDPVSIILNWPCHAAVLGSGNYQITGDWPGAASKFIEDKFGDQFVAPVTIGASGDINPMYTGSDFVKLRRYAKDAIGEDVSIKSLIISGEIKTLPANSISALQRVISFPLKENPINAYSYEVNDSVLNVRLSALKIGNIILTGVSGEVFNQISVKLRDLSPYKNTFMITHCNGMCGYLVTDDSYAAGGYEVTTTMAESGAEKAIIKNLLEMINDL